MELDYLIIGQGLAGSLLAWELLQQGKKVIIVDNSKLNASRVAAGLINPITGMRFVKSAEVDTLLPFAIQHYQHLSRYFQQPFYIEKAMLRLLKNEKEVIACDKRFKDPTYKNFLGELTPLHPNIKSDFGILKQKQTGYLLTQALLSALKDYFIKHNIFVQSDLQYQDIKTNPTLQWQKYQPKHIIFCEGYLATHNPWFSYLPFQLVKGEIITATAKQEIQPHILNYGHWFIPLDKQTFRTGASFDRDNINTNITNNAKQTLFDSLHQAYPSLKIKQVTKHLAGIRPTTRDKMPFIGVHPSHSKLFIFNGFGAKGSLQIPWFCQQFSDYLINHKPLPKSCDIQRYSSLFTHLAAYK